MYVVTHLFWEPKKKGAHLKTKKVLFSNWVSYIMLYPSCPSWSRPVLGLQHPFARAESRYYPLPCGLPPCEPRTTRGPPRPCFLGSPPGKLGKPMVNHRQLPWTCRKKYERNKLLAIWWIFWKNHMWRKMNEMIFGLSNCPSKAADQIHLSNCWALWIRFLWILMVAMDLFMSFLWTFLQYPAAGSVGFSSSGFPSSPTNRRHSACPRPWDNRLNERNTLKDSWPKEYPPVN